MTTATATPAAPAKARTARKSTKLQGLQVFMENRLAVFGVLLLLILLAFSFIGPMFYVTDQVHTDLSISALPPSSEHPLGTEGWPDLDHRRPLRRHYRDHDRYPVRRDRGLYWRLGRRSHDAYR